MSFNHALIQIIKRKASNGQKPQRLCKAEVEKPNSCTDYGLQTTGPHSRLKKTGEGRNARTWRITDLIVH